MSVLRPSKIDRWHYRSRV